MYEHYIERQVHAFGEREVATATGVAPARMTSVISRRTRTGSCRDARRFLAAEEQLVRVAAAVIFASRHARGEYRWAIARRSSFSLQSTLELLQQLAKVSGDHFNVARDRNKHGPLGFRDLQRGPQRWARANRLIFDRNGPVTAGMSAKGTGM